MLTEAVIAQGATISVAVKVDFRAQQSTQRIDMQVIINTRLVEYDQLERQMAGSKSA